MQIPDFKSMKQINIFGQEYWSARDLQKSLGYGASWRNFEKVIQKAMIAATSPDIGLPLEKHFNGVVQLIETGKGAKRKVHDYFLSRDACYFITQNGDPEKPQMRAAQSFFVFPAKVYDMNRLRLQLRLKVADGKRKAIEEIHQQVPEDLPRKASIRSLVEAERRKGKKRLKNKPPSDLETLF